ncbi:polysaccharide biosynthesis/export family protein [Phaeovulum sp.]|uniref:polysaccharide biosynthesis/export family protein n=1 Tax=Phaeovulum sp. TaxID=2934796 RepID=UPI0035678F99
MALLAACSLPRQGPDTAGVISGAEAYDYLLLDVDAAVVQHLGVPYRNGLAAIPSSTAAQPSQAVGLGDVLNVRVLEAGAGGLFATGNGGAGGTDFPAVVVDRSGRISLPYVGEIDVAGNTPSEIQQKIVEKLAGKAIEPQALVNIVRSENNRATVAGEVGAPGVYALSLHGDRISQAIASSGGSRHAAHETLVTLVRNGRTASAYLSDILLKPGNDIKLQRDDLIVLTREPQRYTLSGAVARPGTFALETTDYSVLEAVSAAGGPIDARADATGVFLFRYESAARLRAVAHNDLAAYPQTARGIPTVYRFDMKNPTTQFLAQSFLLSDNDAIYVTNAESVQLAKLMSIFNVAVATASNAQDL